MGTFERFLLFLYLILVMIFAFGTAYIYEILVINIKKLTDKNLIRTSILVSFYFLILILIINSLLTSQTIIKVVVQK